MLFRSGGPASWTAVDGEEITHERRSLARRNVRIEAHDPHLPGLVPDLSGQNQPKRERRTDQVSLLYIILIVVLVLLLLGFFTRGRW